MTQAFNLSQLANKVNTSGQLDISTGATGTLPAANGGTNNGSLAMTAGGTLYTDGSKVENVGAGTSGQVLTSQGASAPIWQTASGGFSNMQVFTSSGTFTVPAGITKVKVTVVGGGGNGGTGSTSSAGGGGGGGGAAISIISGLTPSSTVSITVGGAGGTSSFGAYCSATGGGAGASSGTGNDGGVGGIGSGGQLNIKGSGGVSNGASPAVCFGGSSILGGGANGGGSGITGNAGKAGGSYGGGGGGGEQGTGGTGGAGAAGVVIVEY